MVTFFTTAGTRNKDLLLSKSQVIALLMIFMNYFHTFCKVLMQSKPARC